MENNVHFPFEIKGAEITQNQIMVWGNQKIVRMDFQGLIEEINFGKQLSCLLFQNKNIVMMTKNG